MNLSSMIDKSISSKLLEYQLPHLQHMSYSFLINQVCFDASDTGTGKTYTTIALMKLHNKKPLIVCPKSVVKNWIKVARIFDIDVIGVTNYEALKSRKMYILNSDNMIEYVECPYIDKVLDDNNEVIDDDNDSMENSLVLIKSKGKKGRKGKGKEKGNDDGEDNGEDKEEKKYNYIFKIPDEEKNNFVFIFDEAHRGKNVKSSNSKILIAAHKTCQKIVLISATISDKIQFFKPFGYLFGFYDKLSNYNYWLRRQLLVNRISHDKTEWNDNQRKLDVIHRRLFPKHGSRMKISLLGNLFPNNQIISEAYYLANYEEINKIYEEINAALAELKIKELRAFALAKLTRCRQRLEIIRIPIILEQAEEAIDNGYSVVIFVNYNESMENIAYQLDADCFIHGDQSLEERQACIDDFQSNKKNVIIANIKAGGVGVSLHDLHGKPRMSIISPTWSGQDLVQCLGRIHRAGAKTPAQQKIIFCANTYEETICEIIKTKLTNISAINDGDLIGPNFDKAYIELIDEDMSNKTELIVKDEIKDKIKKKVIKKRAVKNVNSDITDL